MLSALRYLGGKSVYGRGTGKWVAAQLPVTDLYVEPFCGMLGVLLQRPRVKCEIINDTNSRLVNWWRCLRDQPDELIRLTALTPYARDEYELAYDRLDDAALSDVQRAAAYGVVLQQSFVSSDVGSCRGGWLLRFASGVAKVDQLVERLVDVAERVVDVQIENRDASELLGRIVDHQQAVVYCDPPYVSGDQRYYSEVPEFGELSDMLLAQAGSVAISGYGDDWDHLGWRREERTSYCTMSRQNNGEHNEVRREVLWCNYQAAQPGLF